GAVPAAKLRRQGVAVVTGGIGTALHLPEQFLPVLAGQATVVPVGAGMLAAVIEKADIVVLLFKGVDLGLDKGVELLEIVFDVLGNGEAHGCVPRFRCLLPARRGPEPDDGRPRGGRSPNQRRRSSRPRESPLVGAAELSTGGRSGRRWPAIHRGCPARRWRRPPAR